MVKLNQKNPFCAISYWMEPDMKKARRDASPGKIPSSGCLFSRGACRLILRKNTDSSLGLIKFHPTVNQTEESPVATDTDILTGMESRSTLTNEDVPGDN